VVYAELMIVMHELALVLFSALQQSLTWTFFLSGHGFGWNFLA